LVLIWFHFALQDVTTTKENKFEDYFFFNETSNVCCRCSLELHCCCSSSKYLYILINI